MRRPPRPPLPLTAPSSSRSSSPRTARVTARISCRRGASGRQAARHAADHQRDPGRSPEGAAGQGLLDALKNTAGVTSSQTSPTVYNNLSIRGIPVDNRGNYRLDGSLPIVNLIDLPLEDKDRVEALKGASALYYGFTTPSGIINLTMKRPTHAAFVDTDLFGDDNGGVGEHVDANDWWGIFGARVNAVYAKVDSGIDFTQGGQRGLSPAPST